MRQADTARTRQQMSQLIVHMIDSTGIFISAELYYCFFPPLMEAPGSKRLVAALNLGD